jgi:MFS transporter, FSR family, fosmidomycin resistance protein
MITLAISPSPLRQDVTLIGLVGLAHSISHFSQLLLAPLFPWLKVEFGVSYAELGFLLTLFFVTSCAVQAASGFLVDRYGPRPILFAGLALLALAALGYAASTSYAMLAAFSVLAGVGNGVFHPVDYTLLNRRVDKSRLGHAYSAHGITGSLGWALAPALLVPITLASSWRTALLCAAGLAFVVLAVLWWRRAELDLPAVPAAPSAPATVGLQASALGPATAPEHPLAFLAIPAVWMCFGFFFFYAGALSVVQSFAPQSAAQLHAVPAHLVAMCLTIYMVCAAGGMLLGGFLVSDPSRCERIVAAAFSVAVVLALSLGFAPVPALAVPVLFGLMGFATGISGPSRDLLVKRATPAHASGRVYGVVYGGLDIGQALVPLLIGALMDRGAYRSVWVALAVLQGVLIFSAFGMRRAGRG